MLTSNLRCLLAALLIAATGGHAQADAPVHLIGINVAGAEFGKTMPGKHMKDYFFPNADYFAKWQARGLKMIRFPLKWERLQPALNGPLDDHYAGLVDRMLKNADRHGMQVLLDVHNYARYRGQLIGSKAVPLPAYRDLLSRMAKRWHQAPALWGYDIMNEPSRGADRWWPQAAQAGIDGVRDHDRKRPIVVEGYFWSSSQRWPRYNDPLLDLVDPSDNLIFSAHTYIDPDASGQYSKRPAKNLDPMIGVRRVEPFMNWLRKHGKRGHIGEFGVPDDPRYLEAMDNLLAYLQEHCVPITYWAGGPVWGRYPLSVEPDREGRDRPQWQLLAKYQGAHECTAIGPEPASRSK